MLSDDWVRISLYVPENVRYSLRQIGAKNGWEGDSKIIRNILYALLSDDPTKILDLYDTIKSSR